LNVVTTDSYRMMVSCERSEKVAHPAGAAIIPARALKEAARLCAMGPELIDVALTDNSAFFRVGGVMLSTRLIAGSFPEYRKLLPEGEAFEHTFSVNTGELLEVLKRVNLFAARQSPPVPVRLTLNAPRDLLRGCYELALRIPAACWRKRQANATKCSPARVSGSLS